MGAASHDAAGCADDVDRLRSCDAYLAVRAGARSYARTARAVDRYNTRRGHTALAGRTPLEMWRSDPTPVRALEHQLGAVDAVGAQNQGGAEGQDPSQQ